MVTDLVESAHLATLYLNLANNTFATVVSHLTETDDPEDAGDEDAADDCDDDGGDGTLHSFLGHSHGVVRAVGALLGVDHVGISLGAGVGAIELGCVQVRVRGEVSINLKNRRYDSFRRKVLENCF